MKGLKTGGRLRGVPNRATAARQAAVAATGQTPLEALLEIMRDPRRPVALRVDCARAAAPYVHPRMAAVTLGHDDPVAIIDPDPDV